MMTKALICAALLAITLSAQSTPKPDGLDESVTRATKHIYEQIDQIGKNMDSASRLTTVQQQIIELSLKYILQSVRRHPEDAALAQQFGQTMGRMNEELHKIPMGQKKNPSGH